jgi:hypothetical protein
MWTICNQVDIYSLKFTHDYSECLLGQKDRKLKLPYRSFWTAN